MKVLLNELVEVLLRCVARKVVPQEGQDVLAPLAQGRQLYLEDVDAVVEILAELVLRDERAQILVRRADHTDVERDDPIIADAHDFALL